MPPIQRNNVLKAADAVHQTDKIQPLFDKVKEHYPYIFEKNEQIKLEFIVFAYILRWPTIGLSYRDRNGYRGHSIGRACRTKSRQKVRMGFFSCLAIFSTRRSQIRVLLRVFAKIRHAVPCKHNLIRVKSTSSRTEYNYRNLCWKNQPFQSTLSGV